MSVVPKLHWQIRCAEMGKPTLHRELKRFQSFKNLAYESSKPSELAKNGFYYIHKGDYIRCVFCGLIIYRWCEVTDILDVHQKQSKECDFIQSRPCGNIPISDDSNESSDEEDIMIGGIPISDLKHLAWVTIPNFNSTQPAVIEWENDFGHLFESRLETFKNWPKPEVQDPVKLAEAGFYYTGIDDETKCFYCKIGLKNWICTQHPLVEHAYFNRSCDFVRSKMGINFGAEARLMHSLLKNEEMKPGNTLTELVENFRKWSLKNEQSKQEAKVSGSASISG